MALIEEFVNAAIIDPDIDKIESRIRNQLVTIDPTVVNRVLKLPFGITMDPLPADEYPLSRLVEYTAAGKTTEGYSICHCKPQHQPHLTAFVQSLRFKRKTTYISTKSFDVLCMAETLIDREMHWN